MCLFFASLSLCFFWKCVFCNLRSYWVEVLYYFFYFLVLAFLRGQCVCNFWHPYILYVFELGGFLNMWWSDLHSLESGVQKEVGFGLFLVRGSGLTEGFKKYVSPVRIFIVGCLANLHAIWQSIIPHGTQDIGAIRKGCRITSISFVKIGKWASQRI